MAAYLAGRTTPPGTAMFCGPRGHSLFRDAPEHRLAAHIAAAAITCPGLAGKHVTMHTLRHTSAMNLLAAAAGVDVAVIALRDWHLVLDDVVSDGRVSAAGRDRAGPTRSG